MSLRLSVFNAKFAVQVLRYPLWSSLALSSACNTLQSDDDAAQDAGAAVVADASEPAHPEGDDTGPSATGTGAQPGAHTSSAASSVPAAPDTSSAAPDASDSPTNEAADATSEDANEGAGGNTSDLPETHTEAEASESEAPELTTGPGLETSLDAGQAEVSEPDAATGQPQGDPEIPDGYVKGIIGVGYGGLRIVSRDGGQTWGDRAFAAPSGGDDEDLLRAVAYGKGRWIAMGWKLMVSDDGVNWDDLGMLNDGILEPNPIIEGLTYHAGYFYAAGDGEPSRVFRSSDGVEWSQYGQIGETVKHTGLTHRGGLFVSYGDSATSYQSENALDWMEMEGLSSATYCEGEYRDLAACHDAAWFDEGFYLLPEWGGEIRRSTDGDDFETVYRDDQENTLYRSRAVAEGYVIAATPR